MRFSELEPQFCKLSTDHSWRTDVSMAEADGVQFLCPVCFEANHGPVGTHSIICWAPHVPQTVYPTPGRWNMLGSGPEDLTLQAGSSSVKLTGGCNAHFLVRNGEIVPAGNKGMTD